MLGSILDLDHFLAARSFSLGAATSLSKRPFLHNTPLVFAIAILTYLSVKWITTGMRKNGLLSALAPDLYDIQLYIAVISSVPQ